MALCVVSGTVGSVSVLGKAGSIRAEGKKIYRGKRNSLLEILFGFFIVIKVWTWFLLGDNVTCSFLPLFTGGLLL